MRLPFLITTAAATTIHQEERKRKEIRHEIPD